MNYKQEDMLLLAKKVLDKIQFGYNKKRKFEIRYEEKGGLDMPPEPNVNIWVVTFYAYNMDFDRDDFIFMYISDETGRPLQIQSSMSNVYSIKDSDIPN